MNVETSTVMSFIFSWWQLQSSLLLLLVELGKIVIFVLWFFIHPCQPLLLTTWSQLFIRRQNNNGHLMYFFILLAQNSHIFKINNSRHFYRPSFMQCVLKTLWRWKRENKDIVLYSTSYGGTLHTYIKWDEATKKSFLSFFSCSDTSGHWFLECIVAVAIAWSSTRKSFVWIWSVVLEQVSSRSSSCTFGSLEESLI